MACSPDNRAKVGGMWLQLVRPVGRDPRTPVPEGHPLRSTVVGLVPAGVDGVTAVQRDGRRVKARLANGLYTVNTVDIRRLRLHRSELVVRVPRPR
jgi:hypothetical protein